MSVQSLRWRLHARGIVLSLQDGQLKVRAPQGALTDALKTALRQGKDALLPMLAGGRLLPSATGPLWDGSVWQDDQTAVVADGRAYTFHELRSGTATSLDTPERPFALSLLVQARNALEQGGAWHLSVAESRVQLSLLADGASGLHMDCGHGRVHMDREAIRAWAEGETCIAPGEHILIAHLQRHPHGLLWGLAAIAAGAVLHTDTSVRQTFDLAIGDRTQVLAATRADRYLVLAQDDEPEASGLTSAERATWVCVDLLPEGWVRLQSTIRDEDGIARVEHVRGEVRDESGRAVDVLGQGLLALDVAQHPLLQQLNPSGLVGGWLETGLRARVNARGAIELSGRRGGSYAGWRLDVGAYEACLQGLPGVTQCRTRLLDAASPQPVLLIELAVELDDMDKDWRAEAIAHCLEQGLHAPLPWIVRVMARLSVDAAEDSGIRELCWDELDQQRWQSDLVSAHQQAALVRVVNRPMASRRHLDELVAASLRPNLGSAELTAAPSAGRDPQTDTQLATIVDGDILSLVETPPCTAPFVADTLGSLLRHAAKHSEQGLLFVDAQGQEQAQSYAMLLQRASRGAAGLQALGVAPGDVVVLQVRGNPELLSAYWACILAGAVPMPQSLPKSLGKHDNDLRKLCNIWQSYGRPRILANANLIRELPEAMAAITGEPASLIDLTSVLGSTSPLLDVSVTPTATAAMFTTSGSTGLPKAVVQTHQTILSQVQAAVALNRLTAADTSMTWMPLDHVGGFIMFHLRDMATGARQVIVDKDTVLADPIRWLEFLDRYQAATTWAPNFAFALINAQAEVVSSRTFDLSHLRSITNAGELLTPRTTRRFMQLLARFGLRETAMQPAWGMTETCSATIYQTDFQLANIDDRDEAVCLGQPIAGMAMRIVDEHDRVVPEGFSGQLQVRGRCVTPGYLNNPGANAASFTEDRWFGTGDRGHLLRGRLYLTGRISDTIIINGINFAGHEIESTIDQLDGVAVSFTAACALRRAHDDTDVLAIFFSPDPDASVDRRGTLQAIQRQLLESFGLQAAVLVALPRERIPKTSLGKIQRAQLRKDLLAGAVDAELCEVDLLLGNERTLPDWFYGWQWLPASKSVPSRASNVALCHTGARDSWAGALLSGGGQWLESNPTTQSAARGAGSSTLVHFWSAAEGSQKLLDLLQNWQERIRVLTANRTEHSPLRLVLASVGALAVRQHERADASLAALLAWLRSAAAEQPWLQVQHLDADPNASIARNLLWVQQTILSGDTEPTLSWRDGRRHVQRLRPLQPARVEAPLLQAGQFWILTGGLGGIGSALARWLLDSGAGNVMLTGRQGLASLEQAAANGSHAASARWQAWQSLQHYGERINYAAVDLTDASALSKLAEAATAQGFGTLDAVVHLAGYGHLNQFADPALLALNESRDSIQAFLAPKVDAVPGLLVLKSTHPAARMVLCSSVLSQHGSAGFSSYAAANAYLEHVADQLRAYGGGMVQVLAFSTWRDLGMSQGGLVALVDAAQASGHLAMSPMQGLCSLGAAIASNWAHAVIGLDVHAASYRGRSDGPDRPLFGLHAFASTEALARLPNSIGLADRLGNHAEFPIQAVSPWPLDAKGETDVLRLRSGVAGTSDALLEDDVVREMAALWSDLLGNRIHRADASFFELGGNSLKAGQLLHRVREQFGVDAPLGLLFREPNLIGFAKAVQALRAAPTMALPDLVPVDRQQPLPLSFSQQRLWVLDAVHGASAVYNVALALGIHGPLSVSALEQALKTLVQRHEVFRTQFADSDAGPVQVIVDHVDFHLELLEASDDASHDHLLSERSGQSFDLRQAPLIRAQLIKRGPERFTLQLLMHHIISDGWSLGVLAREFRILYEAAVDGYAAPLPRPTLQYADYAVWLRRRQQAGDIARQEAYWQRALADAPSSLDLPALRPRPAMQDMRGRSFEVHLPKVLLDGLNARATRERRTLFMLLLAGVKVTLARLSQQFDLVIGTPVANRPDPRLESLIGFFVNNLPIRSRLGASMTLDEVLTVVEQNVLDAFENGLVPFERIVELSDTPRQLSHAPLFQVMVVLQNTPLDDRNIGGLQLEPVATDTGTSKYDLTLMYREQADGLSVFVEYATDRFDEASLRRWLGAIEATLRRIAEQNTARIQSLPIWNDTDLAWERDAFNQTAHPGLPESDLVSVWRRQVQATPLALALVAGTESWTYAELDRRSDQVAAYLQAQGVGGEDKVGLSMRRDAWLLAALLGVLKAGACYVPLDPSYPEARLRAMVADSKPRCVLCDEVPVAALRDAPGLSPRPVWQQTEGSVTGVAVQPAQLAYVIFTSGSTGRPKVVGISHGNAVNRLGWAARCYSVSEVARVLAGTSLNFDLSVYELWSAWSRGGAVLFVDNVLALSEQTELQPSLINSVPSAVKELVHGGFVPASVQTVNVAGEPLPAALVNALFAKTSVRRVANLYGPSEDTTYSTGVDFYGPVTREPSIGLPLDHGQAYVLDAELQPVPVGVSGELYLGGLSVARGYLGDVAMTARKFVPDPFGPPGARLYRTGDRARRRADGELEFLGRLDHQIKLRGFRIELGEIESCLQALPRIKELVVVVRSDAGNQQRLVAYLVADGEQISDQDVLQHASAGVPAYMVPQDIVWLAALPRNNSGKIDRARLPAPDRRPEVFGRKPTTEAELIVASVFAEVLRRDVLLATDDFFALGGDSISAVRVVSLLRTRGFRLSAQKLFELHQVERVALALEVDQSATPMRHVGDLPLSPIMHWFFAQNFAQPNHWNQVLDLDVADIEQSVVEQALRNVVDAHDMLHVQYRQEAGQWHAAIPAVRGKLNLRIVQLDDVSASEHADWANSALQEAHRALDLEHGVLHQAVVFSIGGRVQRLSLVLHHLASDVISIGILTEQLNQQVTAILQGKPIIEPDSGVSYAAWTQYLQHRLAQPASWMQTTMPTLEEASCLRTLESEATSLASVIPANVVAPLLEQAQRKFNAEVPDVLIASLQLAWQRCFATVAPAIALEAHGRHVPEDAPDISRTVGWFTTLQTIRADAAASADVIQALIHVKEARKRHVHAGLSEGLTWLQHGVVPAGTQSILFNYLGSVDTSNRLSGPLQPRLSTFADLHAPENVRTHRLELTASLLDGALHLVWTHAQSDLSHAQIATLASAMAAVWTAISERLVDADHAYTPSDFPELALDADALDELLSVIAEDNP